MSLKGKLFIFMTALFLLFSFAVWSYSKHVLDQINEKWAERFIKKQILFDKNRTLLPLLHELEIIKEMAKEPTLLAMARNEKDPLLRKNGIAVLEAYRSKFQSQSYFAAFTKSENYYFNNAKNSYNGKQLQYKLSRDQKNDAWFYDVLSDNQAYSINVDTDEFLGTTYIWINYDLKENGELLGIVGTGLDFTRFVRESVGIEQEGVRNFFINRHLDVQLERDTHLKYDENLKTNEGGHKKITEFFTKAEDKDAILDAIVYLRAHPDTIRTFWVEYEGSKKLLGMSFLSEVEWFNVTLIDEKELQIAKDFSIFPMLCLLFLVIVILVAGALHFLIIKPLEKLKSSMQRVEKGNYEVDLTPLGSAEIEALSQEFIKMIAYIRTNNVALEEKIQERTKGLMQSEAKLNTILDSVEAFIYIKDVQYRYAYANKRACEHFGMQLEEIIGQNDELFFNAKTTQMIRKIDEDVIHLGHKVTSEDTFVLKDHSTTITCISTKIPLYNEEGVIYGLCGISTDITERKKSEELIKELAYHDSLTHLPNRRMFHETFASMIAHAKRMQKHGALLVLDLDNFKPLNDTHGHNAGDLLLIEVGKRLRACVREVDLVARFGGDEFLVALRDLGEEESVAKAEALKIAGKIRLHVNAPYVIVLDIEEGSRIITHECSASIGISLFSHRSPSKERVFSEADKAMYLAKQKGRNRIEFYEELG